jgi:hypothetical protein
MWRNATILVVSLLSLLVYFVALAQGERATYAPLVYKTDPTPTTAPTATPSPTPVITPYPSDLIANAGFEEGRDAGWSRSSVMSFPLIRMQGSDVEARTGEWLAWLGGTNNEVSIISQRVDIPSAPVYLVYWRYIASESPRCSGDFIKVYIGESLVESTALCEETVTSGYEEVTLNIEAYAGQSATLSFRVEIDSALFSSVLIDDISFSPTP